MVGPGLPHIGVVVDQRSKKDPRRHMIVHNIAEGPKMEDVLFAFPVTGHYRYNKNNRLIAPRRFQTNYADVKNVKIDYDSIMRQLAAPPPVRKRERIRGSQAASNATGKINIAQLQSESGVSEHDIRALLAR